MSWSRRGLIGAALALGACGFEPLYGTGGAASALRGRVRVGHIASREGYFLRQRLLQRFGSPEADAPFVLDVTLAVTREALAITQNDTVTRFNLAGIAAVTLREIGTAEVLLREDFRAEARFNAPASVPPAPPTASQIAARAAEEDAGRRLGEYLAEQIADRILIALEQPAR
ncbi:LPS assembly lipoprotein LptE [Roseobacter sp. HKCCA0434]|uniref:LPS assembly lipoprotein LptE n=1 Tax=Roseobacter sp. HKCCA0434 TaxID=3079297 RepID=UPI0029058077|nr:LPS assembly lipoprotein LptE [Roseobacter sp. HKCCA0434]